MNGGSVRPLGEVLAARRGHIVATWLTRSLDAYPEHTSHFLAREKDPFRNPVGHALQQAFPALFDELVGEMNPTRLTQLLDGILQVRAVQDLTPSQAVGFLLLLKAVVRESLEDQARPSEGVLSALEGRIDELMLLAFDLFMGHRERIYTLRLNEARRRFSHMERILTAGQP
jgi:hypothetical protein